MARNQGAAAISKEARVPSGTRGLLSAPGGKAFLRRPLLPAAGAALIKGRVIRVRLFGTVPLFASMPARAPGGVGRSVRSLAEHSVRGGLPARAVLQVADQQVDLSFQKQHPTLQILEEGNHLAVISVRILGWVKTRFIFHAAWSPFVAFRDRGRKSGTLSAALTGEDHDLDE